MGLRLNRRWTVAICILLLWLAAGIPVALTEDGPNRKQRSPAATSRFDSSQYRQIRRKRERDRKEKREEHEDEDHEDEKDKKDREDEDHDHDDGDTTTDHDDGDHDDEDHDDRDHDDEHGDDDDDDDDGGGGTSGGSYVVLGYNDLGMHCMNQDFSRLCILPPFNNLHAQVIRRGKEPDIVTRNVDVTYRVLNNTRSTNKTNFWQWAPALFGVNLAPDVGLTGNRLFGSMSPTGQNDWSATGIPITPIDDNGNLDPYPLAEITVASGGKTVAATNAVVPVSWEISCNLCHPNVPAGTDVTGADVEFDILARHDRRHKTQLQASAAGGRPVLCAGCHADPALGTPGIPGVKSLSRAIHGSHALHVAPLTAMGATPVTRAIPAL